MNRLTSHSFRKNFLKPHFGADSVFWLFGGVVRSDLSFLLSLSGFPCWIQMIFLVYDSPWSIGSIPVLPDTQTSCHWWSKHWTRKRVLDHGIFSRCVSGGGCKVYWKHCHTPSSWIMSLIPLKVLRGQYFSQVPLVFDDTSLDELGLAPGDVFHVGRGCESEEYSFHTGCSVRNGVIEGDIHVP